MALNTLFVYRKTHIIDLVGYMHTLYKGEYRYSEYLEFVIVYKYDIIRGTWENDLTLTKKRFEKLMIDIRETTINNILN